MTFGFILAFVTGCASFNRSCSNWQATNFGADWITVQFDMNGKPFNCWKLRNASVANESQSDGIHWLDTHSGHMVHISGWYNYVQVTNGDYTEAGRLLGIDDTKCGNGKYPANFN